MSPEEPPQTLVRELSDSEKKLKGLFDKRDHFNEESKVYREMRDDLHQKRKDILDRIQDIRAKKSKLLEEMKAAKARRDMFNEKARALIGIKRKKDTDSKKEDPYEDLHTIEIDLRKLEDLYQTRSHTLEKEREIVKSIEQKRKKIKELQAKEPIFQAAIVEAHTKEEEIKEYRRLSDEEHKTVHEIYLKLKEINEKMDEFSPSIDHLRKEADKRHEEFLKVRKQADAYHQKAVELRERVLQLRSERNKLRSDARAIVNDQNKKVSDVLDDEGKLDDAAEKAVEMLLKKGKISL